MDFKDELGNRAFELVKELGLIKEKYQEIDKQEELKWSKFLKTSFNGDEVSENNTFDYFVKNMDTIKKSFSKKIDEWKTDEEYDELKKMLDNFHIAKKKLEEAQANRISPEMIREEKKIASAKALYKAIADMKIIVCESIQKLDVQITDLYNELTKVFYTDPKYAELNNKITELKNTQNQIINHLDLLTFLENSNEVVNENDINKYEAGRECADLYNKIADAVNEFSRCKTKELTINYDNVSSDIKENVEENNVPEVEQTEIINDFDEKSEKLAVLNAPYVNTPYIARPYFEVPFVDIPEAMNLDEEEVENLPDLSSDDENIETVVDISEFINENLKNDNNNEKTSVDDLSDNEINNEESKNKKNEDDKILEPKNIKKRPSKVRKAIALAAGAGVSSGSMIFGPVSPGVVMVAASVSKVAVKKALKKNEERENRINELLDDLEQYKDEINAGLIEEEKNEMKEKFSDALEEVKMLEEKLRPDLDDEKYNGPKISKEIFKGPQKVKAIVEVKDKLKAKISKFKAYLGSTEGLKEVNLFLNAALITSAGLSIHNGLTTLINLNKMEIEVGGLAGEILSNPTATQFLEGVDKARRMGGL